MQSPETQSLKSSQSGFEALCNLWESAIEECADALIEWYDDVEEAECCLPRRKSKGPSQAW
jgi:hypothetical protein